MAFMEFGDPFFVGHPEMDHEHAVMFRLLNGLHLALREGKDRQEIQRLLTFLRYYTDQHFQTEDRLMLRSGFPGYAAHKAVHEQLTAQVLQLETQCRQNHPLLSLSAATFLKDWLAHHLSPEDGLLARHLQAQGQSAGPTPSPSTH